MIVEICTCFVVHLTDMEVEVTTQFSDESTPLGNSTMGGPDNNSTLASGGEDVVKAVKDSSKLISLVYSNYLACVELYVE